MPRIHMPDGTVLEAPYDIPREQLRAWADAEMEKRRGATSKPAPGFHPGVGSMPFPRDVGEAAEIGDINRAQSAVMAALTPPGRALGGAVIRAATHPVVGAGLGAAYGLSRGHSPTSVMAETAFGYGLGRIPRVLARLRKMRSFRALTGLGEDTDIGRRAAEAVEALTPSRVPRPVRVPRGQTFEGPGPAPASRFAPKPAPRSTSTPIDPNFPEDVPDFPRMRLRAPAPSEPVKRLPRGMKVDTPPFLPKGKMRLDLGPREQTTITGTVETARPLAPKPQFSSTGAVPRGKVTQPNVRVRTEGSMDPAKQGGAFAKGPVTPRSTPAGKTPSAPSTPPAADDDVGAYIERSVRDTGMSKRQIIDAVKIRYGATSEQARTAVDAIFSLKGLTRQ